MEKKLRTLLLITLVSAIIIIAPVHAHAATTAGITYQTQIQSIGWQGYKSNGQDSGTVGQAKRLEAIKINLTGTLPAGASIQYEVQSQTYGWSQGWRSNGQEAGTTGQGKRLEAIRINLVNMPGYSVQYRVQVQSYGWQSWVSDGALSGTVGKAKRLETIDIRIVKVASTTNDLIKQRYESELSNYLQEIQQIQSQRNVRIYENGKWQWEADQSAINRVQALYNAEYSYYQIWLSTI